MLETSSNRIEQQALLILIGRDPDQARGTFISANEFDWNYFLKTAEEHSIIPILYKAINSNLAKLIPVAEFKKLKDSYKSIAKFNFARTTQLIKIVTQLEKYNLPVIAYKGMTLAEFAYQDLSLRQFGDIHLFIRKKDFLEVKKRLLEIGCKEAWELSNSQEKAVLKYYYEYPFFYGENNTFVEVHWEFVEPFFTFEYEIEEVWKRTTSVKLYGKEILTLSAEDYLIILSSHGSKHFWKRLSWICDVARLIENKEIDWQKVIQRASKYGSLRMVWIGTYLASTIFGTNLPEHIKEKMFADKTALLLGKMFLKNLFEEEKEPSEWKEMAKIHLLMRENLRTKFVYSQRLFMTKLIDKLFMPMGRPR